MQSIENRIAARIQGKERGTCFTPKAFLDLGSPEAVRIALHRLEKRGVDPPADSRTLRFPQATSDHRLPFPKPRRDCQGPVRT